MNLLLKIVNNPKEAISAQSHEFKKEHGTIGRGTECSWVLADKAQAVSSLHLEVEYRNGIYYMIDLSTNGTLYKNENKRVAPKELVAFEEGDVLSIGPYDVLVGFVKSQSNAIDDILNKREIDIALEEKLLLKKKGRTPFEMISKERVEEQEILDLMNIKPSEAINLEDAFDDVMEENLYTTHITPPTFENEVKKESVETLSNNENLLQSIFAQKLGINLSTMNQAQQIEVVSELAQTILVALEGVEKLEDNAQSIEQKLQKPHLKVEPKKSKGAKSLLQAQIYGANPRPLSQKLSQSFNQLALNHTALYEASKTQCEELEHEFAPNTLAQEFKVSNPLLALLSQDTQSWRAYVTKYHHLNEISTSKGLQAKLFKKYASVMETFKLAKGNN